MYTNTRTPWQHRTQLEDFMTGMERGFQAVRQTGVKLGHET